MTTKRTTKKAPAEAGANPGNYTGPETLAECGKGISDEEADSILRFYKENSDRRRSLNTHGSTAEFHNNFGARLSRRLSIVYQWAFAREHEELCKRYADLWAYTKILERSLDSHFGTLLSKFEEEDVREIKARRGADERKKKDPKAFAMEKIRKEWLRMFVGLSKHRSDSQFARDMAMKYREISNEGSIKNAISRWRKQASSI
jgi:hypothetical protein